MNRTLHIIETDSFMRHFIAAIIDGIDELDAGSVLRQSPDKKSVYPCCVLGTLKEEATTNNYLTNLSIEINIWADTPHEAEAMLVKIKKLMLTKFNFIMQTNSYQDVNVRAKKYRQGGQFVAIFNGLTGRIHRKNN